MTIEVTSANLSYSSIYVKLCTLHLYKSVIINLSVIYCSCIHIKETIMDFNNNFIKLKFPFTDHKQSKYRWDLSRLPWIWIYISAISLML